MARLSHAFTIWWIPQSTTPLDVIAIESSVASPQSVSRSRFRRNWCTASSCQRSGS